MFNSITKTLVGLTLITMNLQVNGQMSYNIRPYANLYRNNYSMSNCSVLPVSHLLTSTECSNLTMVGSYSHTVVTIYFKVTTEHLTLIFVTQNLT